MIALTFNVNAINAVMLKAMMMMIKD